MVVLEEDHINPEAVEVHYQTPEELKLQNSAEPKVVVHDDDVDSDPIAINDPPVAPVHDEDADNHEYDVPVAPSHEEDVDPEIGNTTMGYNDLKVNKIEPEHDEFDVPVAPVVHPEIPEMNPVDVAKKNYDSIIVAKDGDHYYTDADDVHKCACLRNESVIKTLNGIIATNEDAGINTSNLVVVVSESTSEEIINTLKNAKVNVAKI